MSINKQFRTIISIDFHFYLFSILTLSATGCSHDWRAETVDVVGSISINAQTPEGAFLMFHPVSGMIDSRNSIPWAVVSPNGTFHVSTYDFNDGIPEGDYKVCVAWRVDPTKELSPDRLMGAYLVPDHSVISVSIRRGDKEIPPIQIDNAKINMKIKVSLDREQN